MYQSKYWHELKTLKTHLYYLELYLQKDVNRDKTIKIILAITSSSSIAGWAIWNSYSYIWATIIAVSQIINVIKTYLPYKSRINSLSGIINEFEDLFIFCENNWYDVSEGKLTTKQIHELHIEIKKRKNKTLKKFLPGNILPIKKKIFEKAETLTEQYLEQYF